MIKQQEEVRIKKPHKCLEKRRKITSDDKSKKKIDFEKTNLCVTRCIFVYCMLRQFQTTLVSGMVVGL